jgi:putative transposase
MPEYRRIDAPGATIFFTVVTDRRRPILASPVAVDLLRAAFRQTMQRDPFAIDAIVVLPDHVHTIWTLPDGDGCFARRWSAIKAGFTRAFLAAGGREAPQSRSRRVRGERGVWQRRFWDHVIRDDDDFGRHVDYIHYNPVKHGLVRCPHAWPHSSFHRHVREGTYPGDWMCACAGRRAIPPDFGALGDRVGE